MRDKILFIKWGSFSLINDSIFKILKAEFPEYEVDVIDMKDINKNKIHFYHHFVNLFFFLGEYAMDFIRGDKKIREFVFWIFNTSYLSLQFSKYIRQATKGKQYKFSFQTQALFNGKIEGIPHFIYTDHTTKTNLLYPDINPRQYIRSDRFIKRVEYEMYNDADMVFTCGSLVSHSLISQYNIPENKVRTVFAGSNVTNNFVENIEKYSSKNILFVGVEWERKGGPVLVKVFEKVLEKHKDASLTIVGCSPQGINLPNCTITGRIPGAKVADYYNKAALFCLPTLREPFGIVFIEAMHYKLPIIANNVGSIYDMVQNDYNGYLVDNDVQEYADKICVLFDDPEKCRQLGENGYQLSEDKFTWEHTGKLMKKEIVKFL